MNEPIFPTDLINCQNNNIAFDAFEINMRIFETEWLQPFTKNQNHFNTSIFEQF